MEVRLDKEADTHTHTRAEKQDGKIKVYVYHQKISRI